jgi:hypothetical protein
MEYVFLIITNEQTAQASDEQVQANIRAHYAFSQKLVDAGAMRGGNPLQPPSTSTTLRTTDGTDRIVTDGPYSETKEVLGGYYVVEAADLDEALKWASELPLLPGGAVEVRPAAPMG